MVSGGAVTQVLSSATSLLQKYLSDVSSTSGSWQGASADNLQAKASEFASNYSNTLKSQMTNFANACNLYQEYQSKKQSLYSLQSGYNSETDDKKKESYKNQISSLSANLQELKSKIQALLSSISSAPASSSSSTTTGVVAATTGASTSSGSNITTTTTETPTGTTTVTTGLSTTIPLVAQPQQTTTATQTDIDWTKDSNFTYYSQRAGWKDYVYSRKSGSSSMAETGCGPTSMAMVLNSFGYNINPESAAKWSTEHGYHNNGTTEGYFTAYANDIGVESKVLGKSAENIKNELKNDKLVILFVGPGDFTKGGHFIVARGYNEKNNQILIADPYNQNNNKWYDLNRVVGQLKGRESSWSFTKKTTS